MDLNRYPLDIVLVPLSLSLTAAYHVYIWHSSKAKQPATAIGLTVQKRETWAKNIVKDNKKNGMLGVQSLRNSLMSAILSATIAISITTALAALANNTYNSSHLLRHKLFGSQGGPTVVLKYASATLLLLCSFVVNSMAIGCIIEGNFLINSSEELFHNQAVKMLKKGCLLALVGNRVLYATFPVLMWLSGPLPMALSSAAMVWVFYNLDMRGMGFKMS